MLTRLILVVLAAAALGACGADDEREGGAVGAAVAEQLRYVDPRSASVAVVDMRWNGDNWDDMRPIADRLFEAFRDAEPDQAFPGSLQGAAEELAQEVDLKFSEDIEPALDGHLVIASWEAEEQLLVYHTPGGDLRPLVEATLYDGERLRPAKGYEDTLLTGESSALVGGRTLVQAYDDVQLRAALDRALRGDGYPAARLAEAERDVGLDDPLVLATGDLRAAQDLFLLGADQVERARESVPYLRALRRGSLGIDVSEKAIEAEARLVTDGEELSERDLPVGPAGDLELPKGEATVAGGNRDQSFTTVFGATVARALFADSRFVRAVERAEKELGISFEDEVLRQFDCPSVSVLDPPGERTGARFAARSCVNDPDRMRELLPRLRPYLPAILDGLDGLGIEGLTALLLLAPDAPLVPGAVLAQIDVNPLGGEDDEQLYEIKSPPRGGPDRIVFGLIGDAFVVATDEVMARRAAGLETETLDEEGAGAVRLPVADLLGFGGAEASAFSEVFDDLVATIGADPDATVASARLELRD